MANQGPPRPPQRPPLKPPPGSSASKASRRVAPQPPSPAPRVPAPAQKAAVPPRPTAPTAPKPPPKQDDSFTIAEADDMLKRAKDAWNKKDFQTAFDAWTEAVACDPTRAKDLKKWISQARTHLIRRHLNEAKSHEANGFPEDAMQEYRICMRLEPDDPDVLATIEAKIKGKEARQTTREVAILISIVVGVIGTLSGLAVLIFQFVS